MKFFENLIFFVALVLTIPEHTVSWTILLGPWEKMETLLMFLKVLLHC